MLDAIDVVGVPYPQHVPAVTEEARRHVFRERDARVSFDGDVVVVVNPAEVIQAEVARQGRCFGPDALHEAAVPAHNIDTVIEDLEARPIIALGEPLLRDGHAHARGNPLPQRTGGCLHARYPVIFRVSRGLAVELTKMADVVKGNRRLPQPFVVRVHRSRSGEMKHGPKQHGGMAIGKHKAIAVGPDRVQGIETHDAVPDGVDERRQCHRCAGVTRVGLLDRVHR
jgi:hypothetical protein